MKRAIHHIWGKWMQQTVGSKGRYIYIKGYTPNNKLTEIRFSPDELDDLIYEALRLKRRL